MLDFHQLEHNIAGCALHPFVTHVGIPQIGVAGGARSDSEGEFLDSGNDLLGLAEMALPAYDLALALASRTSLRVEVVVASAELDPAGGSALAAALLAGHYVVGVLRSCPLAVRAGYLLLN